MMYSIVYLIIHSIFAGTSILVPILFVVYLFKVNLPLINQSILIRAVNCTLLLGSVLFIAGIIVETFIAYYSGSEYEQYTFTNRIVGPYWFYFWLSGIGILALLPQILWVKKFRRTIVSSIIIVSSWCLLYLLSKIILVMQPDPGWHIEIMPGFIYYVKQGVIYIVVVGLMYIVLYKKMLLSES